MIRLLVSAGLLFAVPAVGPAAEPAPKPRLGINFAGIADWSSELPFVDVFRCSRPWISQQQGKPWGQGPTLDLDENGWVKRLAPGCAAETVLLTLDRGYPVGRYTLLYKGRGKIEASQAARIVEQSPGRMVLDIRPKPGASAFLKIVETDPADYVRDIRLYMPGVAPPDAEANPWNPDFLKLWRGVACVRFMDLMHTNDSEVRTWADRPRLEHATFAKKGVPVELLCDLANRLKADPWFCMPHQADDEYVRQFARAVKGQLSPERKVYVEYSNEVWNSQFKQHRYAAEQGKRLGLGEKDWEAAWRYTAVRSVEIFRLWEREFGGRDRLVRVLPSQAGNAYVAEQIVGFRDTARHADALAIAPYLSMNIGPNTTPPAAEVAGWTVDQVLDHLERHSLPETAKHIADNKTVADKYGLKLIAYEGGQHMVGIQGAENNEALTKLFHAANAHPRLEGIYDRYFAAWDQAGGGLFCYFASVGVWAKWGSWGMLQYLDDDQRASPKWRATMRWAASAKPGGGR